MAGMETPFFFVSQVHIRGVEEIDGGAAIDLFTRLVIYTLFMIYQVLRTGLNVCLS